MGMMGKWPSPDCVCNDFWQHSYTRTGVLEFSRDRCADWEDMGCVGRQDLQPLSSRLDNLRRGPARQPMVGSVLCYASLV
jgi:hypothetical protein